MILRFKTVLGTAIAAGLAGGQVTGASAAGQEPEARSAADLLWNELYRVDPRWAENSARVEQELAEMGLALATGVVEPALVRRAELLWLMTELREGPAATGAPLDPASIVAVRRTAAEAFLGAGDPDAALAALRPEGPTDEDWIRILGYDVDVPLDFEGVGFDFDASWRRQLDLELAAPEVIQLMRRAELERDAREGSAVADAWLDEILDPWASEWVRARFEGLSLDLFESVSRPEASKAPDAWEVEYRAVEILRAASSKVDGYVIDSAGISSLTLARPELIVELDAVIEPRLGLRWRRALVAGLEESLRFQRDDPRLIVLSDLIAAALDEGSLILDPNFGKLLEIAKNSLEVAPRSLVDAWTRAVRTGAPSQSLSLLSIWSGGRRVVLGRTEPIYIWQNPWNAEVQAAALEHASLEVRLAVAPTFIGRDEGRVMLGWAGEAEVGLRWAALAHAVSLGGAAAMEDAAASAALEQLAADPDPELRATAIASLLDGLDAGSDRWFAAALKASDAEERRRIVAALAGESEGWRNSTVNPLASSAALRDQIAGDPDPGVRAALLGSLWRENGLAGEIYARAAMDPSPAVIEAVDRWLFNLGRSEPGAIDAFVNRLSNAAAPPLFAHWDEGAIGRLLRSVQGTIDALWIARESGDRKLERSAVINLAAAVEGASRSSLGVEPSVEAGLWRLTSIDDRLGGEALAALAESLGRVWTAAPQDRTLLRELVTADSDFAAGLVGDRTLPADLRWEALRYASFNGAVTLDLLLSTIDELRASGRDALLAFSPAYHRGPGITSVASSFDDVDVNRVARDWIAANPSTVDDSELDRDLRRVVYSLLVPGRAGDVELVESMLSDYVALPADGSLSRRYGSLPFGALEVVVAANADSSALASAAGRAIRERPDGLLIGVVSGLRGDAVVDSLAAIVEGPDESLFADAREAARGYSSQVKEAAALSLLRFPDRPRALEALRRGLLSSRDAVRATCESVLERHRRYRELEAEDRTGRSVGETSRVLLDLLSSGDAATRAEAARGLATLGSVEALPELIAALADSDEGVRAAVREALDRLHSMPPPVRGEPTPEGSAEVER